MFAQTYAIILAPQSGKTKRQTWANLNATLKSNLIETL